jgi:regulatory protein YycI of two-component signal transduction system YycFG
MDWSKTKTILIITLIIVNVFLLYFYIEKPLKDHNIINEELITLLENKGVRFNEETYEFPKNLPKLYVNYKEYDEVIIKDLLGRNFMKNNDLYINKDYYVEISDENVLTYARRGILLGDNHMSEKDGIDYGETFLKSVNLYDDTVHLDRVETVDDYIRVTYKKVVDGGFVEEAYMQLELFNNEVISLKRKWLTHEVSSNESNRIIPLEMAVYKFETKINTSKDLIIENIALGYVLENDVFVQNIQSGEAFPFYKFELSDGSEIYIEAIDQ